MTAALPRRQLGLVDEFLTGYIVGPGLCLNFEVTDRLRLGSSDEVCLGQVCPLRRLCLSRALRLQLDAVAGNPWLRRVFEESLQEIGNGP
ncbi:MAG TPA: hypothetical protein VNK05_12040 [Chloroflexota bacterium]|jgi:hypothetical protein|nr:hypothetical protein [Chloroflexota bacterium]